MADLDSTELVEAYDYLLKLVIIGESGTGKSCLLHQFMHSTWKEHSQHTIGVEFSSRTITVGDKRVKLQLWDTAGQERFRSVTRSYYRGAAALVLTYDITRRQTFTALPRWLADARALASEGLKVVLVGTKSDLEEEREVSSLEAGRWAEDNDVLHLETSSLTPHQPHLPFTLVSRAVLLSIESGALDPERAGSGVSYGERQLRSWGSAGGGGTGKGRRGRGGSGKGVELGDLVGKRRCC